MPDHKRAFRVRCILFIVLAFALPTLGAAGVPDEQTTTARAPESGHIPNIVLVLMDNFGYGEVGVYGGGGLRGAAAPRNYRPPRAGVCFTHHKAETECTPPRAGLRTRRHRGRPPVREDGKF